MGVFLVLVCSFCLVSDLWERSILGSQRLGSALPDPAAEGLLLDRHRQLLDSFAPRFRKRR